MYSKPVLILILILSESTHNFDIFKRSKERALHVLISFKLLFKVQLPSSSALDKYKLQWLYFGLKQ
jgi:hypothetical protein